MRLRTVKQRKIVAAAAIFAGILIGLGIAALLIGAVALYTRRGRKPWHR